MRFWYVSLAVFIIVSGCTHNKPGKPASSGTSSVQMRYASGFTMEKEGNLMMITVSDPWQNAIHTNYTYILSDTAEFSGMIDGGESVIRTPVKRVVCLSTTHIGFIDFLGKTGTIVGISGGDFVVNQQLRDQIENETIFDVGYDENINYEMILKLKPDVVFAYGVTSSVTRVISKLQELKIPVVLVAEYLEEDPLAKMEWVKFFAAFYGIEYEAESKFDANVEQYIHLSEMAAEIPDKPRILLGLPWRGTWYVSGGKSYAAKLISDAGGEYVWGNLDYKDSKPVDIERVYEMALTADFWLNTGEARSRDEIAGTDERFKNIQAFTQNTIYNNNKILGPDGGNAYFESGVVEPHIILADLISIFHPQLLPSRELTYYQKLQ